ncbi:hypothetical protein LCGC14_2173880 [marine sediment metagenome]|uniref:Radical SAM core domain-containing protein n=1 Tax=marine sediment metagenome TaxID=412755 RepID=A0A0F9DPA7_9ZZZZ
MNPISLFRSQSQSMKKIKLGFIEIPDQADNTSSIHSTIFQLKDITFSQREVVVHFDIEGRFLNIELRKDNTFPIKLLERTFQGIFHLYEDACINLHPDNIEANYYYDYYQEKITNNLLISLELLNQVYAFVKMVIKENIDIQYRTHNEFLRKILYRYSWEGLLRDQARFHKVYTTSITVLPPETRPDINPLFAVIQSTQGCWTHSYSRKSCAFCISFRNVKYREKNLEEILQHIEEVKQFTGAAWKNVKKFFLSDADPLFTKLSSFKLLQSIRNTFLQISSFETFVSTTTILSKTLNMWKELKECGLRRVYWGVESADNETLRILNKPQNQSSLYKAAQLLDKSGINYVIIVMSGIGMLKMNNNLAHVDATSTFIASTNPQYVDISKFESLQGSEIYKSIQKKEYYCPSKEEIEIEHRALIEMILLKNKQCKIRGAYGRQFF